MAADVLPAVCVVQETLVPGVGVVVVVSCDLSVLAFCAALVICRRWNRSCSEVVALAEMEALESDLKMQGRIDTLG